ncbi:glucose-6-phosphate/phosphate translocator 1, chloroplastic-like [Camellia sinensis]|uniref:glucose-6-phosphate/phosphate translocator 1, chloroplastic-like n=1 Tax=Camellia sinensis TaxID=4442 RepID=UPI001036A54C|nr:glucose-6-phosphate/phosphate translocator 1, chloroplastic-like [Camellia sinensis]
MGSLIMLISWATRIVKAPKTDPEFWKSLSLVPIIGGCAHSAATELNFNMTGFMGAMISNLAFVFRNIFSKRGMKGKAVSGMNYYACLSIMSLLILTPFAIAVEGLKCGQLAGRLLSLSLFHFPTHVHFVFYFF